MPPLVSICIPQLGRPASFARLLRMIRANAEYEPYEIVTRWDELGDHNRGCPTVLAECVEASKGDFVFFIGNDSLPQPGFLRIAMEAMAKWFPAMDGLVVPSDSYWAAGELPIAWLGSKQLLPALQGFFFFPQYHHCADMELSGRCRKANKYVFCPEAKIWHNHPIHKGMRPESLDAVYRHAYDPVRRQEDCDLLLKRAIQFGFPIRENFRPPIIPRKAFSIWLGDALMPPLVEKCIASQRQFTLGWDYKVITSENCPRGIPYIETALAARKWVKAADYLRLWLLDQEGGVYFDADVELLKPFPDEMLTDRFFCGVEVNRFLATSCMGCEPGHPLLKRCMDMMKREFRGDDDFTFQSGMGLFANVVHAAIDQWKGLGVQVYEPEYFHPYDHKSGAVNVTENTVAYHWFARTWVPAWDAYIKERRLKFVIDSPPFGMEYGGVVALHRLAHNLTTLGYEAYIAGPSKHPEWGGEILGDRQFLKTVTVYSEVVVGNPLGGEHVVRWILNTPGEAGGDAVYGPDDLIFKWSNLYSVPEQYEVAGLLTAFRDYSHFVDLGLPRAGTCYAVRKAKEKPLDQHPADALCIDDYEARGGDTYLIDVFNRSGLFICYDDHTMLPRLAALCGCPAVIIPGSLTREEREALGDTFDGVAYGFDDAERARETLPKIRERVAQIEEESIRQTQEFVKICESRFQ